MKKLLMAIALLLSASSVNAQDIDTQLLNLKNEAASCKENAIANLLWTADKRNTMCGAAEINAATSQCLALDLTNVPGYEITNVRQMITVQQDAMTVSYGIALNISEMFDEWNMDPNDPYTQMMTQWMQGPFQHESYITRRDRLYNKGSVIGGQTLSLDESLVQIEASRQTYKYGLSLLDPNDPSYSMYSMMYICMIEYCEDALFDGYAKSIADWEKAGDCFYKSRLQMEAINSWVDTLIEIRDSIQ